MNRITARSIGTYNANEWLNEGDGLYSSACTLRATWHIKKRNFSRYTKRLLMPSPQWQQITGMPRASMLLLGYAMEMYLKAGLVKAYAGCREEMLKRDLQKRFSHDLASLAKEIDFPVAAHKSDFDKLSEAIRFDRYPIEPNIEVPYHAQLNERTQKMWGRTDFLRLRRLTRQVRKHALRIDSDERQPASHMHFQVDKDGYLALRFGGRLRPRITFRFSTEQQQAGKSSRDDMLQLFLRESPPFVAHYWESAYFLHDDDKKTHVITMQKRLVTPS